MISDDFLCGITVNPSTFPPAVSLEDRINNPTTVAASGRDKAKTEEITVRLRGGVE